MDTREQAPKQAILTDSDFDRIDANHDGIIDRAEFRAAFSSPSSLSLSVPPAPAPEPLPIAPAPPEPPSPAAAVSFQSKPVEARSGQRAASPVGGVLSTELAPGQLQFRDSPPTEQVMRSLNAQLDELAETTKSLKARTDKHDSETGFSEKPQQQQQQQGLEASEAFLRTQSSINSTRELVNQAARAAPPRATALHADALDELVGLAPMQASAQRYRESVPNTPTPSWNPRAPAWTAPPRGTARTGVPSTPHEHSTASWKSAADAKLEAQVASGKLRQTIVGVKHAEQVLAADAQAVVAAANGAVETTREHFEALHRALAAREEEIVAEIEAECSAQLGSINESMQSANNTLTQADVAYGVAGAILKADDREVLSESPAMREWACLVPSSTAPANRLPDLERLMPALDKGLLQVLSAHGSLPRASQQRSPEHAIAEQLPPQVASSIRSAMQHYIDTEQSPPEQPPYRSPVRSDSPERSWWHQEEAPPRPTPVKCTRDSVTLVWDAAPRSAQEQLPNYRMEYTEAQEEGRPAGAVEVLEGNRSRVCTVGRLQGGAVYRFRVRAEVGREQWSKPSEWSEQVQLGQRTFYLI